MLSAWPAHVFDAGPLILISLYIPTMLQYVINYCHDEASLLVLHRYTGKHYHNIWHLRS